MTPTEQQIEDYRQWLVKYFEPYGEYGRELTEEESRQIELDRR
jgi:hypothetical protein